jgi:hypothetical protein
MAQKCQKYRRKCEEFRRLVRARPDPDVIRASRTKQIYEKFPFETQQLLFDLDYLLSQTDEFLQSLQRGPLLENQIYSLARSYINRVFQSHCETANKPFWVNKTPRLLLCLRLLTKLYPNARCVHIVRDGRDVAASFRTLAWGPKDIGQAARRWRNRMEAREDFDSSRLKYREVRYEDLIQSPANSLKDIFEFLGINADSEEIVSKFKVYDHRLGAWRNIFTKEDRTAFAREAGKLLIELGYEKDHGWVACGP